MPLNLSISDEELSRVQTWLREEIYPSVIEQQKTSALTESLFAQECWAAGYPFEGASGGSLTYEFTPTSIGVVVIVRAYGQVLDITDYESW